MSTGRLLPQHRSSKLFLLQDHPSLVTKHLPAHSLAGISKHTKSRGALMVETPGASVKTWIMTQQMLEYLSPPNPSLLHLMEQTADPARHHTRRSLCPPFWSLNAGRPQSLKVTVKATGERSTGLKRGSRTRTALLVHAGPWGWRSGLWSMAIYCRPVVTSERSWFGMMDALGKPNQMPRACFWTGQGPAVLSSSVTGRHGGATVRRRFQLFGLQGI